MDTRASAIVTTHQACSLPLSVTTDHRFPQLAKPLAEWMHHTSSGSLNYNYTGGHLDLIRSEQYFLIKFRSVIHRMSHRRLSLFNIYKKLKRLRRLRGTCY